jgi:hypothetical protein
MRDSSRCEACGDDTLIGECSNLGCSTDERFAAVGAGQLVQRVEIGKARSRSPNGSGCVPA